jgi:hypothetical protein
VPIQPSRSLLSTGFVSPATPPRFPRSSTSWSTILSGTEVSKGQKISRVSITPKFLGEHKSKKVTGVATGLLQFGGGLRTL